MHMYEYMYMYIYICMCICIIVSTYFDLPRNFPKKFLAPLLVQIQNLACGVFEFVPLLDDKVQKKGLEIFWGGSK